MPVPAQRVRDADAEYRGVRDLAEVVGQDMAGAYELAQRPLRKQREDDKDDQPGKHATDRIDYRIGRAGKAAQEVEQSWHGAR